MSTPSGRKKPTATRNTAGNGSSGFSRPRWRRRPGKGAAANRTAPEGLSCPEAGDEPPPPVNIRPSGAAMQGLSGYGYAGELVCQHLVVGRRPFLRILGRALENHLGRDLRLAAAERLVDRSVQRRTGLENALRGRLVRHSKDIGLPEPVLHVRIAHQEVDELDGVVAVLCALDELRTVYPAQRALLGQLDVRHMLAGLLVDPVGEAEARRLADHGLAGADGVGGHDVGAGADLE